MINGEVVAPRASALIHSLRDFGYSTPAAIADLVDNSISADAKNVNIDVVEQGAAAHIVVIDDGTGMSGATLIEAMRLGGTGPLRQREERDLGRFGLGMKTASLSQGRMLTVITKVVGEEAPTIRRWDLQHVAKTEEWSLLTDTSDTGAQYIASIADRPHGTAVIIEDLDRPAFTNAAGVERQKIYAKTLRSVHDHLAMVFQRFLQQGIVITVGSSALSPWDPFLTGLSDVLPSEPFPDAGGRIVVTPFILPHHSKLTPEQHEDAAGPAGWNAQQGFYVYRGGRLIVSGSWLNLGMKKEEHFKLARIRVDLPNTLDSTWQLNVVKSRVAVPGALRGDFERIALETRRAAAEVYRFRGDRAAPAEGTPARYLWVRKETPQSVVYRIDRTHPLVQSLLFGDCGHSEALASLLALLERSVPIANMLIDPPRALGGLSPTTPDSPPDDVVIAFSFAVRAAHRAGIPMDAAAQDVLRAEPFCFYRQALLARTVLPADGSSLP